jgi:hypothetical protein
MRMDVLNTALVIFLPRPECARTAGVPEDALSTGGAVTVSIVAGSALVLARDGVACFMVGLDKRAAEDKNLGEAELRTVSREAKR